MATIIRDHTPRELGYRMPAEWEKHTAVWLQWPGQYPLTPDTRDLSYQMKMEKTWLLMAWEIHYHVHVCILAQNEAQNEHIRRSIEYFNFNSANISIHVTATVDVWHRDTGPVFLTDDKGGIALTDWNFNGWGSYPLWGDAEKHLPQTIADIVDKPLFIAPIFTEGGAIEVNGTGSFLGTRSSIINDNRNPGISRTEIEQALSDYLCVSNFIWLSGAPPAVCEGIFGDGTDYHIDIAARFADKNTVLYAWTDNEDDVRYPYLEKHRAELGAATDENGNPLKLIPLELPQGSVCAIGDRFDPVLGCGSDFTDASYLNYLVTNELILVPAFGNVNDAKAQETLSACFTGRKIVPIPAVSLTAEGGAIHCVTQQQPAP